MKNSSMKHSNSWLQKLKDESWEAELLISAIAIFGTIKLFMVIDWVVNLSIDLLTSDQYIIGYAIAFGGLIAISILITMFVIHFSLRAYWVGLVGLNSVFPDYGLEDSAYSEIYTKKMQAILPKLKETIQKVDELCSVIFSAAFFMLLLYLYLSLFICIYLFLFNFLSEHVNNLILLTPFFLLIVIITLSSLLGIVANFKIFKQKRAVQLAYFISSKWVSMILLGPLYKYLLQISMTFASNFRKKKSLIGLIMIFIAVGFIITMIKVDDSNMPYLVNQEHYFDDTKVYHGYYRSKAKGEKFLLAPQIDSDVIDIEVMQLFIPVFNYERKHYKSACGDFVYDQDKTEKEQLRERKTWYLNCYTTNHQVFLNGEKIVTDFMKYELPKTNQFGIINYVSLEEAKKGANTITIIKNIGNKTNEWTIPFHYVPN